MALDQHDPFKGSGPPHLREKAQALIGVVEKVPYIMDLLPETSALSLAFTCWGGLLALLRHGRRTIVGDVEWHTVPGSGPDDQHDHRLALVDEERLRRPVLRVLAPHGALLRGLALRTSVGGLFLGQVDMCGARFSVHGARGLYAAARRAGLRDEDVATETQRMRALGRMLQLPAPRGTTLQVSALDVPSNFLSRDVSRAVFDERVAVALSLIGAPAVRRHVTKVTMHLPTAGWCLYEPFELMEALCNAEQLHTLHLVLSASDEAADNDDMFYAVAKLVRMLPRLRHLHLQLGNPHETVARYKIDNIEIDAIGPRALVHAIAERNLESLHLSCDMRWCLPGQELVACAMQRWSGEDLQRRSGENLRRLSLPGCAFATNAITSLAGSQLDKLTDLLVCARANVPAHLRTLATTSTLRNVDLSGSCIRTVSLERLCGAITSSSNLRLEQLRLNRVQMTDHGGQAVAAMLATHPSLRALSLQDNHLGGNAACYLAAALAQNGTLRELDVSGNVICKVGVNRLLHAVGESTALQVFAMERNRRPCSVTLGDMLGSNTTLRSLKLGGAAQLSQCFICQSVGTYRYGMWLKDTTFSSGLACNRTLRILSFKNLYFLEKLGASIALALRSNTGLRELTMEGAGISTKDGALLAESLRLNDGLQHVSLNENPSLCGETLPQFSRVVKQHRKPQRLDILGHTYHGEAGLGMPMRPVDGPGPAT